MHTQGKYRVQDEGSEALIGYLAHCPEWDPTARNMRLATHSSLLLPFVPMQLDPLTVSIFERRETAELPNVKRRETAEPRNRMPRQRRIFHVCPWRETSQLQYAHVSLSVQFASHQGMGPAPAATQAAMQTPSAALQARAAGPRAAPAAAMHATCTELHPLWHMP